MSLVAGVRLVSDEIGESDTRLVYVDPDGIDLAVGDRVVVAVHGDEQVGVVILAPRQLVESALVGQLPPIRRRARPGECPTGGRDTAGLALLRDLGLPGDTESTGRPPPTREDGGGDQDRSQQTGSD